MLLGISYASAASCTDIVVGLARFQESSSVYKYQQFLVDKGYLKATPNGYFGLQTLAATKQYQTSIGLSPVGTVGPMTRAAIKKETCSGNVSSTVSTTSTIPSSFATNGGLPKPITVPAPVIPTSYAAVQYPNTASGLRNAKRQEDITALLKAMYASFVDSRGVHSLGVTDIPQEMCSNNTQISTTVASGTGSGGSNLLVTSDSPCSSFVDISYLSPKYITSIPRDPKLATTSPTTGYTVTRSVTNDIVIAAKSPEDGAIIQITCNFNGFCKNIQYISTKIYKRPNIDTMNRSIFLRDAWPRTPLILKGTGFTDKNTVKLFSLYNSKEYNLGTFLAANYSTTTKSISVEGSALNQEFSCGPKCSQKLPLGDYMLSVVNEGGESNTLRLVIRGFTTSSLSTQVNGPVIPTTKNVKVGTITLSSTIPVTLKSLTLTASSTAKDLPSKITNITLKDTSDASTYTASGDTVSFGDIGLYENQSKVYDVYVDVDEVLVGQGGFITYSGKFLVSDDFGYVQLEIPAKDISFSVSH